MKQFSITLIVLVLAVVFGSYMFVFQVRYDEVAILARFDHADPETSVYDEPGPHFKWPRPIEKVYRYSQKLQVLEDQLEELQTSDGYAVILNMFVIWKIENPYDFHRTTLGNIKEMEEKIKPELRDLKGVISQYAFTSLVNSDPEQLKLDAIEQECVTQLNEKLAKITPGYGIRIEAVGIRKLVLPEKTTEKVFERMRTTRERMAEKARSEGKAAAATIRSEANSAKERILAFAERRAQGIRAIGDQEASKYYKVFKQDEPFAKFLRRMQTLRTILDNNTTFMFDTKDLDVLNIMDSAPDLSPTAVAPGPKAGASTN